MGIVTTVINYILINSFIHLFILIAISNSEHYNNNKKGKTKRKMK